MHSKLIDNHASRNHNGGPKIARVYRDGGDTVRVRAVCDTCERDSYAIAEVLTPGRTWTDLVSADVPERSSHEDLSWIADGLFHRALAVLGA